MRKKAPEVKNNETRRRRWRTQDKAGLKRSQPARGGGAHRTRRGGNREKPDNIRQKTKKRKEAEDKEGEAGWHPAQWTQIIRDSAE